jgi:prepilin-type N-terminal cleavage/methylation domain-containing protein
MLLSGFPQDKDQSQAEKRFSGFTIVELLVAMMIGSILAISVVALFINQTRAMALNEDLVDLQQNLRIAMDFLHRDSRMAGANTKDVLSPFTIGVIDDVDVDRDGDVDAGDVINSEGGASPDALQVLYAEAPSLVVQKYKGLSNHLWV